MGLAIDWVSDRIYWTDSELKRIEVANIDGTKRAVLFSQLEHLRDIVVDPINKYVLICVFYFYNTCFTMEDNLLFG